MADLSTTPDPAPSSLRLYTLLVGINQYRQAPALSGPVADVQAVERYLRDQPDFQLNVRRLCNEEATKTALIDAFRTHLRQATAGDTILFYFSGHGTQEEADRERWAAETDGRLECLVCYDGAGEQPWDYLLADKELRYLIHELTQTGAHIVTIFDCCHSGDNTRNFSWLKASLGSVEVRERRLSALAPLRPWSGFLFSDSITENDLKIKGIDAVLPQDAHLQLAACESDESAVEVGSEGIFTKNLLNVLRTSGGLISYGTLHNRVRQYMRFGYQQRPRIYAAGSANGQSLQTLFLNRPGTVDAQVVEVTRNSKEGWQMDVGAIHGVGQTTGTIQVVDPETGQANEVGISLIGPDYTILDLPDALRMRLNRDRVYRATVSGLLTRPVRLYLAVNSDAAGAVALLAALSEKAGAVFVPEEQESEADFALWMRNGLYYLTRPLDPYRPLVQPIVAGEETALTQLAGTLQHLARWHYLKELRNTEAQPPFLPIEVIPTHGTPVRLTQPGAEPIPITLQKTAGEWSASAVIRLHNPTRQPLYCTVLYLSRDFMSNTSFLETNQKLLPGETLVLGQPDPYNLNKRDETVSFFLEEVIRQYNWPGATEHYQFILTADPLSETTLAFLTLDALPSPPTLPDLSTEETDSTVRAGSIRPPQVFPKWWTQRLDVRIINPLHNQVAAYELQARLQPGRGDEPGSLAADVLADCTLGLYYETAPGNAWQSQLAVKPDIQVIEQPGQKGLWMDVKLAVVNPIANRMRLRQYKENLFQYPDRLRIVAEGDSWFQYPFLVKDIIDYLSGVHNVYSIASAGDLLANYLKKPAFLELLAQQKPAFLLLSGGGNDILGEQFRDYLRDQPDDSLPFPERHLNDNLIPALDKLQEHYRRLFRLVELGYPDVKVIVHGYDYIIPIDTALYPKKSSWLGRYMIERGMSAQADREALIRYIIDAFNERLAAVAGEFKQASYLDLRGTVRRTERLEDNWYDEIHPNDKGFLSVASRFFERIDEMS
ncbi:caspase family protein [Larkinella sp. VNQ87]|uniref:caspase family protein n=1 Tax=Larkinella sp. VNQ87 TaxID=3400921 RepID=UPI003C06AF6E